MAVCVSFVYSYDLLALGRRFSETVLFFSANILSQKMPKIAGHNSLQTNISIHSQLSTKLTLTGIVRLGDL